MRTVLKLIRIVRLHNVAAAVLSTYVGFVLADSRAWPWRLLAAVAVVTAAGYVINDLSDVDIDRINKPKRPLPSGGLTFGAVKTLYAVLLALLCGVLFLLPPLQAVWIAAWASLLHLYSVKLKRRYLAGNVLVSLVSASGFLLGAFAGGRPGAGAVPAAFTFLFVLGREFVKDCDDMKGDGACGARTVPIVSGERAALRAASVIFVILTVAFPVPYIVDLYGRSYGLVMVSSVIPILVVSIVCTVRSKHLGIVSVLLKMGMFFGILAFYFGRAA